jgi:hypothetical protein
MRTARSIPRSRRPSVGFAIITFPKLAARCVCADHQEVVGPQARLTGDNVDYYQAQVIEYLRSDRAIFVNTECCIQLKPDLNPKGGEHWYCDIVACDFRGPTAYLCEVSHSKKLPSMVKRLRQWHQHWDAVCAALYRDGGVPGWTVRPWLFVQIALSRFW